MTLGCGAHRFEWDGKWARLPEGRAFGKTHGVVTDARDNVYIFNTSPDAMCVFDREGQFISSWGAEFKDGAHGLFLSKERQGEFLYLTDHVLHLVVKTTLEGREIWRMGAPPRPDIYRSESEFNPTDVCVAPDGTFYVFDGYGKPWVHRYGPDAKYIDSFGGEGSEPGRLKCPHGGWVDTRDRSRPVLYVADRGNNRIQKFTLDGQHVGFITDQLRRPCCFFQFGQDMYIPDLDARVTIFDRDDKLITHLGDNPDAPRTKGWPNIQDQLQPGKFNSPHACCVDSRGDLYVAEWISTGRVTKLRRQK
ncbi:hypothetical protein [Fontivita pretiosa]|uniref:hypothetical protein n=1 Tax=Fontivita pretiosa TaxID=2989684 RepID=UPI003D1664ED